VVFYKDQCDNNFFEIWQGLILAMHELMPWVPHRYCVMHL